MDAGQQAQKPEPLTAQERSHLIIQARHRPTAWAWRPEISHPPWQERCCRASLLPWPPSWAHLQWRLAQVLAPPEDRIRQLLTRQPPHSKGGNPNLAVRVTESGGREWVESVKNLFIFGWGIYFGYMLLLGLGDVFVSRGLVYLRRCTYVSASRSR